MLTSDIMREMNNLHVNFLPELKRLVNELNSKIKELSFLGLKGNQFFNKFSKNKKIQFYCFFIFFFFAEKGDVHKKLVETHQRLQSKISDYNVVLNELILTIQSLDDIVKGTERIEKNLTTGSSTRTHSATLNSFIEAIKLMQLQKTNKTICLIEQYEPTDVSHQDITKVKTLIEYVNTMVSRTDVKLNEQLQFCKFSDDLEEINKELHYLNERLKSTEKYSGDCLASAKASSQAFHQFESTIDVRSHSKKSNLQKPFIFPYQRSIFLFRSWKNDYKHSHHPPSEAQSPTASPPPLKK